MKAVYYTAAEQFSVIEVPDPQLEPNQVLIKVKSCGVCRTDLHLHEGEYLARYPLIPGHEFVGDIVKVGSAVTDREVGERVCADNTVLCGHCYYCKRNQPLYCENFYSLGVNGPGGYAEYVVVNHDKVFPLGSLTYDQGVMAEPLACAVHGMDMIQVTPGDDVLLFGTGPSGLLLMQLLKYCGAANLVVVASSPHKLEIAKKLGADHVIKMDRNDYSVHENELKRLFPQGFDIVVEATGVKEVTEHLPQFGKKGSKVVLYGVPSMHDEIKINAFDLFMKEMKLITTNAQTHCFDRALKFLQNGIVKVDELITHRFQLEDYGKALEQVRSGRGHIKVVVDVQS